MALPFQLYYLYIYIFLYRWAGYIFDISIAFLLLCYKNVLLFSEMPAYYFVFG